MYAPMESGEPLPWNNRFFIATRLVYYVVMFMAGIFCIVVYIRLSPIFSKVNAVVEKASVLFRIVYEFACVKEPILHAAECALLQSST